MRKDKLNTNRHVDMAYKRLELSCSLCPPNRSENKKSHKKHGTRKPKSKNKRG